jgi:hypothetical protein
MSDDLSMQLRELRKSTDELNVLTDKANDLVRRAEAFLSQECRVGGPVYVFVSSAQSDDDGPVWSTYLGYDRHKGELRIVVSGFLEDELRELKPWAECSRDLKLETLDALPKVIQELSKKVRKQVADVKAKVELLDSMIPSPAEKPQQPAGRRRG